MCYIFNCFGWMLDLVQRFITFFLACCLCCAVSLGLIVALVAGVAYGYNYSLAEFIHFKRSDVTVYMKRGQFYEKPSFDNIHQRRSGGDDDNTQNNEPSNTGIDYNELRRAASVNMNQEPALGGIWQKAEDTRRYAEKLIKYGQRTTLQRGFEVTDEAVQVQGAVPTDGAEAFPIDEDSRRNIVDIPPEPYTREIRVQNKEQTLTTMPQMDLTQALVYYKLTASSSPPESYQPAYNTDTPLDPPAHPTSISITPNVMVSTRVFRSRNSPIVMRNFNPVDDIRTTVSKISDFEDYVNRDYDKLGRFSEAEHSDHLKPSYFKNIHAGLPKSQYVHRLKPPNAPSSNDSEYSQEDEERAKPVRVPSKKHWILGNKGSRKEYPMDQYYET